jgi:hypothetical protein
MQTTNISQAQLNCGRGGGAFRWHGTAATDSRLPWDYPMDKKGPQRQATKALSASGHTASHKFVAA